MPIGTSVTAIPEFAAPRAARNGTSPTKRDPRRNTNPLVRRSRAIASMIDLSFTGDQLSVDDERNRPSTGATSTGARIPYEIPTPHPPWTNHAPSRLCKKERTTRHCQARATEHRKSGDRPSASTPPSWIRPTTDDGRPTMDDRRRTADDQNGCIRWFRIFGRQPRRDVVTRCGDEMW